MLVQPQMRAPRRHPAEEELIALATGQLDVSRRVLLEGHLTYCQACREAWANFAAPGGQLLDEAHEEPPPSHVLDSLLTHIAAEKHAPDPYAELPLPGELLAVLPRPNQPLAWDTPDHWTDHSKVACLMGDRLADAQLFLLKIPGGEQIPKHQHLGHEHVLCLAGACFDEHTRLEAGDYYHYDPETEHLPIMDPGEPCWIAVRSEKGVHYPNA